MLYQSERMIVDLNVTSVLICILAYILAIGPAHFLVCKILKKYSLTGKGGLEGAGAVLGKYARGHQKILSLKRKYEGIKIASKRSS